MAAADTARLIAELTLKDKMSKGVDAATKKITGLERKVGSLDKKLRGQLLGGARTAGRNIERGITVGIVAAGGALAYATKQAADQETAIAGIAKTVDGDISAVIDSLKTMASQVPVSFAELAGIAELGGAMGIAKDDLAEFTKQVAILSTTTNVSAEDAATALGQMGNVIGLTGDEFDNFAAALVDLGNKGESTEAQILEIARRAGGAARLFGIAKDETLGWAAAAANLGLNEEAAGTALQNLFIKSMPAFLKGNKTLQKVTGKTAKELKQAFEKDASGALESFLQDLGKLPTDQRLAAVQKLFGKGSNMTRLVLGLTGDMDNLTDSLATGTEAWGEATAASEEAAKKWATTDNQLKILKGNLNLAAATIGQELLPVLADLAKEGVKFLQDPSTQRGIKAFAKDIGRGARDAAKWLKSVDWGSIANGLKTAASFAKGLIDAFLSMPPSVKATLAALYGLNKLTGGMVIDIGGTLFEQFLGRGSPANPMFVVPVGGTLGPGVPGAAAAGKAGKGGGIGSLGKMLGALALGGIAVELKTGTLDPLNAHISKQTDDITAEVRKSPEKTVGELRTQRDALVTGLDQLTAMTSSMPPLLGDILYGSQKQALIDALQATQGELGRREAGGAATNDRKGYITAAVGQQLVAANVRVGDQIAAGNQKTFSGIGTLRTSMESAKAQGATDAQYIAAGQARAAADAKMATAAAAVTAARATQTAGYVTANASRGAGYQVAAAGHSDASRIVGAIWAARPIVNSYTINNTSTVTKRYGPQTGSRNSGAAGRE